jgi:hypothetical protein
MIHLLIGLNMMADVTKSVRLDDLDYDELRTVIQLNGTLFYLSTGNNSKAANIWFPFKGLNETTTADGPVGWLQKMGPGMRPKVFLRAIGKQLFKHEDEFSKRMIKYLLEYKTTELDKINQRETLQEYDDKNEYAAGVLNLVDIDECGDELLKRFPDGKTMLVSALIRRQGDPDGWQRSLISDAMFATLCEAANELNWEMIGVSKEDPLETYDLNKLDEVIAFNRNCVKGKLIYTEVDIEWP